MSSLEDTSMSSSIYFETSFEAHMRNTPVSFSYVVS